MAGFQPIANTTGVKVFWTIGAIQCLTTFYYRWANNLEPTATELQSLCNELQGSLVQKMAASMHNSTAFRQIEARNLAVANGLQFTHNINPPIAGAGGGSPNAANTAARIARKSTLAGRSKKGAISISNFSEGSTDGNSLGSALMGLLAQVALEMLVQRVAGRFLPATASPKLGTASILGSAGLADSNVDSQKTRLNGRGN